ncbi:MAG: sodium:calcium antiporter [Hyphomicrobiales bacterium]|jgi:cation:H+ antiporter
MLVNILLIAGGGALLYLGGNWLVDSVSGLALGLRVPHVMVALIVVGFGTSAPELVVAINAMLAGSPDIALGNVIGSNLANLLLVLALAALVTPIIVDRHILHFDGTAIVIGALGLWLAAFDGTLSRLDACLLFLGMLAYLGLRWRSLTEEAELVFSKTGMLQTIGLTVAALIALPVGSHMFIGGAAHMAATLGVSEAIIGLTVVAIGTSLPEIATCLAAAFRKQVDTLLGGVLGSNVFNSSVVVAGASMVGVIPVVAVFQTFWLPIMVGASLVTILFLRTGFRLSRLEAMAMLALYGGVFLV